MDKHISKHRLFITLALLSMLLCNASVNALEMPEYIKIATSTIEQAQSGKIKNIDVLIKQQEKLIELGLAACNTYIENHPDSKDKLAVVMSQADDMKKLSLMEIEEHWHSGKELKKHGIEIGESDHFGAVHSLMDSIIHPATSYIALLEYKKTGKQEHLDQVVAELSEVLLHISHIK